MKKLMLGALAALCAMMVLPALAVATPAHLHDPEDFTVHGTASALSRVAGGGTTGTTVTGSGSFHNTTTGTIKLTFHHATSSIGTNCTTAGQPTGTVTTTNLTFHLVMLATNVPGILVTGGPTVSEPGEPHNHFATFGCGIFIPSVVVKGNGILGTITSPKCNETSNTATISFKGTEGVQEHPEYTGTKYTLESSLSGGAMSQSAMTAHATITFNEGATPGLTCTH